VPRCESGPARGGSIRYTSRVEQGSVLLSRVAIGEAIESLRETAYPGWLASDVTWEDLDQQFEAIEDQVPGDSILDKAMALAAAFGARATIRVYRRALRSLGGESIDGEELRAACRDTGFDPAAGRLARFFARRLRAQTKSKVSPASIRLQDPWFEQLSAIESRLGIAKACRWAAADASE